MSNHFVETYKDATKLFTEAASSAGAQIKRESIGIMGIENEDLCIDFALFRNAGEESPTKLLLYTAGTHGVEGFTGTSVLVNICEQLQKQLKQSPLPAGVWILLIHAVNPFGMSWHRRVNENGVDLNRNWLEQEEFEEKKKLGADALYKKRYSFLQPKSVSWFDFFFLRGAFVVATNGYHATKQSLARGQYTYPEGLFFGGVELQNEPKILLNYLKSIGVNKESKTLKQVHHTDIHTGLGAFGHCTYLTPTSNDEIFLHTLFKAKKGNGWHVECKEKNNIGYKVVGLFYVGLRKWLCPEGCQWTSVAEEFGTLPGLKVTKALRNENFLWTKSPRCSNEEKFKKNLLDSFSPRNQNWRIGTQKRAMETYTLLFKHFVQA